MILPGPVGSLELGFLVMSLSAGVNLIVSRYLYKIAKETDSVALEADALHLKTDVYTSAGVALGLLLIWITGLHFLDPVIAMVVALLIIRESVGLFRKAYEPLLDSSIPPDEVDHIRQVLNSHCNQKVSYHNLRTRKAGQFRYVDLHLNLDENLTVRQAHELCDTIETEIKEILPRTEITIHVENF
jgi:cation diffusion facilitator family transporter